MSVYYKIFSLSLISIASAMANQEFLGRLEFTVKEKNPEHLKRSQDLFRRKISYAFSGVPQFNFNQENVRVVGPTVVVTIGTQNDLRNPIVERITQVVDNLSGYVDGTGDFQYFQPRPVGNIQVEVVEDAKTQEKKLRHVNAKDVRLQNLLEVIKKKLRNEPDVDTFTVATSKDCGEKIVSIDYVSKTGGTVEHFLKQLATDDDIPWKKVTGRTPIYLFVEDCGGDTRAIEALQPVRQFFPSILSPETLAMPMQVNFIER